MIKKVHFKAYQLLKAIYKVTIITACDTEAVIFMEMKQEKRHEDNRS